MLILDRFEGDYGILEIDEGQFIQIPKSLLPEIIAEGDVLKLVVDEKATLERKEAMANRLKRLFERKTNK